MSDDAANWRAEAACHAAWPAVEEIAAHGWRLRFAAGHSHRANSANPLVAAPAGPAEILPWIEAEYAARNLAPALRLPDLIESGHRATFMEHLARHRYRRAGESLTLQADLPQMPMRNDPDLVITATPGADWLATQAAWRNWDTATLARYSAIVARVAAPAGFMALSIDGIAAMAFAKVLDGTLCLNSMMSDPARRGAGHSKRLLGALLAWGIGQGAREACLQVEADNAPALALYRAMGFTRTLYGYRYWVR